MTTVTPFSKYLALSMLVIFPVLAFFLGRGYEQGVRLPAEQTLDQQESEIRVTPMPLSTENWKTYYIQDLGLSFLYPTHLEVASDIRNSTALAADREYWVAWPNSDSVYLRLFVYRSDLAPIEWWTSVGKDKFERLADEVGAVVSKRPNITLSYTETPTQFFDQESLDVVVSSDYETPQTPKVLYVRVMRLQDAILMTTYSDVGTEDALAISQTILNSLKVVSE